MTLRAPFPWFGGKSRVAHLVWPRFGDVANYVEPFAGSLAVLLGRPHEPKAWGYGGLVVVNLFAWRATKPTKLPVSIEAVGPDNDVHIVREARSAHLVVAAWGHLVGWMAGRDRDVRVKLARYGIPLKTLALTQQGFPRHPLYLPGGLRPVPL